MKRPLALLVFACCVILFSISFSRRSAPIEAQTPTAATTTPRTATPGASAATGPLPNGLGNLPPCPDAVLRTPNDGSLPSHPLQPGDRVCDARSVMQPRPDLGAQRQRPRPSALPNGTGVVPAQPGVAPKPPQGSAVGSSVDDLANVEDLVHPLAVSQGYLPEFVMAVHSESFPGYGVYAVKQVSAVTLASPADTLYDTMHVWQQVGAPPWSEVGWACWGTNFENGQCPAVYAASCDTCLTVPGSQYFPISVGQELAFLIAYEGNGTWYNFIYWGPYGGWTVVSAPQTGFNVASGTDVDFEAYTDAGYQTYPRCPGCFLSLPQSWVYNAEVYYCPSACQWYTWDTSVPGTGAYAPYGSPPYYPPYYIGMVAPFYYWSAQG